MTKEKIHSELTTFLKKRSKKLKNDWNDVPLWIIEAATDFFLEKQPSEKDKCIERAYELLFVEAGDIVETIKLIANSDADELIDYIDGVDVWEKVQFSFTVEQFLEYIGYKKEYF